MPRWQVFGNPNHRSWYRFTDLSYVILWGCFIHSYFLGLSCYPLYFTNSCESTSFQIFSLKIPTWSPWLVKRPSIWDGQTSLRSRGPIWQLSPSQLYNFFGDFASKMTSISYSFSTKYLITKDSARFEWKQWMLLTETSSIICTSSNCLATVLYCRYQDRFGALSLLQIVADVAFAITLPLFFPLSLFRKCPILILKHFRVRSFTTKLLRLRRSMCMRYAGIGFLIQKISDQIISKHKSHAYIARQEREKKRDSKRGRDSERVLDPFTIFDSLALSSPRPSNA